MRLRDLRYTIIDPAAEKRAREMRAAGCNVLHLGRTLVVAVFVDLVMPDDVLLFSAEPSSAGPWSDDPFDACWVAHPRAWNTQMASNIAQAYRPEGLA